MEGVYKAQYTDLKEDYEGLEKAQKRFVDDIDSCMKKPASNFIVSFNFLSLQLIPFYRRALRMQSTQWQRKRN